MKALINKICLENQEKIAYSSNEEFLSYKDLWEKAYNLACYFSDHNYQRIIIKGNKESFTFITIVACLISRITYIPVSGDIPPKRLEYIQKESNADLIIDSNFDINVKGNNIKKNNNETAYIIFTSGSTGSPKGVPISYKNLFNFIDWLNNKSYMPKEEGNVLNTASFSFDLSVCDIYYSVTNGNTLYALNTKEPNEITNYLIKNKINYIVATPSFIKLCLLSDKFNKECIPTLKYIFFCGEILDSKVVNKLLTNFPNLNIINAYGPTECTCAVCSSLINKNNILAEIPVGDIDKAACNIYLEDDEMVIEGASVFNNYLNKNEPLNKFYTKDLGYIKDNKLYFKGRKDNQIKLNGYRIEIEEVENVIKKVYNLDNCLVLPIKHNNRIIRLKCLVKEGIDLSCLKEYLPDYMIPTEIELIDKFIYNQNNKIDRKGMYEKYSS